jgi:hypothetical protein
MLLAVLEPGGSRTHPRRAEEQPVVAGVAEGESDVGLARAQQPLPGVAGPPGRQHQRLAELLEAERQHLPHQVLLAGEVAVDGRGGHAGLLRHRTDGHVPGVPGAGQQPRGGLQQLEAKAFPLTLPIADPPGHAPKIR